jgi:hypothetical protein
LYRTLRRIFGPKGNEIIGGWRKLHNEEFHNACFSPNIIKVTKSNTMRWSGYIARMGGKGNA